MLLPGPRTHLNTCSAMCRSPLSACPDPSRTNCPPAHSGSSGGSGNVKPAMAAAGSFHTHSQLVNSAHAFSEQPRARPAAEAPGPKKACSQLQLSPWSATDQAPFSELLSQNRWKLCDPLTQLRGALHRVLYEVDAFLGHQPGDAGHQGLLGVNAHAQALLRTEMEQGGKRRLSGRWRFLKTWVFKHGREGERGPRQAAQGRAGQSGEARLDRVTCRTYHPAAAASHSAPSMPTSRSCLGGPRCPQAGARPGRPGRHQAPTPAHLEEALAELLAGGELGVVVGGQEGVGGGVPGRDVDAVEHSLVLAWGRGQGGTGRNGLERGTIEETQSELLCSERFTRSRGGGAGQ